MARALVDVRILQREYLLAISRALTAELDLHDVLRIILQAAVEIVSGRAGMIVLSDPDSETLRVAAVYGIPANLVDNFAPLIRGVPYQEGEEHKAIPELTARLNEIARQANLGLTAVTRIPMISRNEVIGLIYVFQSSNYVFAGDVADLLRSFAEQAAIAVRNARLYQQVNKEKQRLDAILEQSADGVMILDRGLRITVFNKALSTMTGWPAHEAIGLSHAEVVQWERLRTNTDLAAAIANGWPMPGSAHLYVEGDFLRPHHDRHQTADGRLISLGITYAPFLDGNGRMTDIIANVRDLTRYREEEQLQKTFISVISHELKTPVSIIKGYAGTLRRQDANWSREIVDESLTVIEEEADNLTDLIDNLLEVSRLQAGTFSLAISDDVQLPKITQTVVRKFSNQTNKHFFFLDFPQDFPTIWGDERRLTQVLNNLLSNAIKYSIDGGQITIRGTVHANHVTVAIADEGIGIPEYQQHRIFQQFSRLDNALSRKTEGTGLGLYLTRAIVEAHNGRIWFANNTDGPGTTFTFSLPIEQQ
ncbi:MAG: PAS domain S-box protein [Chloroflexi bacterium]|nr:PAS domain S-box protein [Chloroflexota bacterium]MBK6712972.1 PAS domain S-box protein [Chloroflexota bacterium]MBK7177419.1 PAS domain S-box protein [Chloroflexota bacterium]MBK7918889.1 PAS domain S-box protein [Chloroflexota bacterium]MBP6804020.1 PAS domain S-box protein [Chloroflexota bacterium]